jgi:ABC-type transport system involved in multi-copper enzyme maturation permease subunit
MLSSFGGAVIGFTNVGNLLGIIAYCVFAAQTAQEYTYGTLRNLLVRQPGRMRLLAGKLISMKIFALVMVAISGVVSIALAYILAPGAKVTTDLWFTSDGRTEILQAFINVAISVVGFGIVGMIMGLLLRSPISSISIGVLWLLIIENLLGAVKSSTLEWLPGNQLAVIALGGNSAVSYTHAMSLAAAYIGIGALIASILFSRRDVAN